MSKNLVSGRAVKPGDVLKSHSGNSVEITDTDGEGRLILADAISYARRHYRPKAIFDYATLTGGVVVALGDEVAGYLTNRQLFRSSLALSSAQTGEELWELPLIKSYEEQIKSGVADLKNVLLPLQMIIADLGADDTAKTADPAGVKFLGFTKFTQ